LVGVKQSYWNNNQQLNFFGPPSAMNSGKCKFTFTPLTSRTSLSSLHNHALYQHVVMYYRSGTGGHCCICAGQTLVCIHQVAALLCMKCRIGRRLEITTS